MDVRGVLRVQTLCRALGLAALLTLGSAVAAYANDLVPDTAIVTTPTQPAGGSSDPVTTATEPVSTASKTVTTTITTVTKTTQPTVSGTTGTVSESAKSMVEKVATVAKPVVKTSQPVTGPVVDAAKPVVSDAAGKLGPVAQPVGDAVEPIAQPLLDAAQPAIDTVAPLTDPVTDAIAPVADILPPVTDVLPPGTDVLPPAAGDPAGPVAPSPPSTSDLANGGSQGSAVPTALRNAWARTATGLGSPAPASPASGPPSDPFGHLPLQLPFGVPTPVVGGFGAYAGALAALLDLALLVASAGTRRRLWSPIPTLRGRSLLPAVPPA